MANLSHIARVLLCCGAIGAGGVFGPAEAGPGPVPRPPAAAGKPMPLEPARRRVMHLKVSGDLDSGKLVEDFAAALAGLAEPPTDVLILELNGNRFRSDVVAAMIRAARSAGLAAEGADRSVGPGPEWIVWLNDPQDGRVGTGAAALGAVADRCYLGHRTEISFEPGDDGRELAPAGAVPDWAAVDQELQGAVWSRLQARNADVLLAAALPNPRQPLWLVSGSGIEPIPRLAGSPPPSDSGQRAVPIVTPVVGASTEAMRLRLDAAGAQQVRLVTSQAREIGQILASRQFVARPMIRKDVQSGLVESRRRLFDDLAAVDAAREQADRLLDEAERLGVREFDRAKRRARAGSEAAPLVEEALKRIVACEALMKDYPELLGLTPPGQTDVGTLQTRAGYAWNTAFQLRRTSLTDLKNRAARLRN